MNVLLVVVFRSTHSWPNKAGLKCPFICVYVCSYARAYFCPSTKKCLRYQWSLACR